MSTPAPRIYVTGMLRTISDEPPSKASIEATVFSSPHDGYVLTSEAIHSQNVVFAVRSTGEWTSELVWAAGVVYKLSAPGWMPDLYLDCDLWGPGQTVDGDVLSSTLPGGSGYVERATLSTLMLAVDRKLSTASAFNARANALWRKRLSSSGALKVLTMGDSKSCGVGASNIGNGWAHKLVDALRTRVGANSDTGWGYMPAWHTYYDTLTPAPTRSAGATTSSVLGGLGIKTVALPNGESVTWPSMPATKVTVYYTKSDFFPGTANILIDGAQVGSINTVTTGGTGSGYTFTSGHSISFTVAPGSHVVRVLSTLAGGQVLVDGVLFETATTGIKLYDGGHGGFQAWHYAEGIPGWGGPTAHERHWEAFAAIVPDLVVIGLGANDMENGLAGVVRWRSNLVEIVRRIRLVSQSAGVVLLVGTARAQDAADLTVLRAYEQAARDAIGDMPGVSILYESDLWLPNADGSDPIGWLADSVHPSDLGHARIAEYLTDRLLIGYPASSGGGGGVTDHGALTGLDNDDHPHYLTAARGDARYAAGNDPRLSNPRTPTAHAASHAAGGSDALTLTAAQLSDLTETVQDIVGALIVAGSGVTVSYNDAAGTFTINSTASGGTTDPEVVRDVIGAAMVAGAGIQLTVNDAGDTITVASTAVLPTRQIIAGTGLTGGGDLSADRTLAVTYGTTAGTAAQGNDPRLSDSRAPTAHASTHGSDGSDPISVAASQVSDSTITGRAVLTAADAAAARAVLGIAPIPTFVVATTATSNSTVTPTNCSGLSLSGLAAGLYEFDLYVRGQSAAAATGVQVGLNWAGSGATPTVRGLGTNLDAGAPAWSTPDDADTSTILTPGNAPAANSPFLAASFTGMLRVAAGGMTGPLNVTVASEVAASQVQVLPDSFIRYRRIAN